MSVNANFPEVDLVRELVAKHPGVSVGVHLNPVAGAPCLPPSDVPSLVGADGLFHGGGFGRRWKRGQVRPEELEAEFDAQIARVRNFVGDRLTHLDSHQNSHLSYFDLFLGIARKWAIPFMRTNASRIGLEATRPGIARFSAYARRPHVALAHLYRHRQMRRAAAGGCGWPIG